jgi:hypothetical protein
MEQSAMQIAARDVLLHRVLPFVAVTVFAATCGAIAIWGNAWVGGIGLTVTLGSVLTAYLTGARRSADGARADNSLVENPKMPDVDQAGRI